MMFGYACDDTDDLMPMPIWFAHRLAERLSEVRRNGKVDYLRPDGKTQVTIEYDEQDRPTRVDTVVVSTQHKDMDNAAFKKMKDDIIERIRRPEDDSRNRSFGHLYLQLAEPVVAPVGESRSNWQVMRLLAEALDAGAFGFSTGLVYAPSVYGNTDELVSLARSMASRRGLYFSHIRGEAATLEQAAEEAIKIGEQGGVPVQIAHVKASGRENWGKMDRLLRMIDAARARGVDVTGDVYPYPAGSTKMDNLLPAWMHDGGISKLLERLTDPKARQRAIADCLVDGERWRTGSGGMGWDEIMIATCSKPELAGIHVAELARRTGKEPAHAMMDLVMEERAGVSMVVFSQSEDNVGTALAYAHNMVGSDSLSLHAGPGPHPGKPHPRSYGTFPRVLGVYCREKRLFSWETAVHKMTGMAATKLGLKDRGVLQTGRAADITLFDPATVRDEATFPDPHRHPVGIPYVIVNGQVVVDGAQYHARPAGRVLTPQ
jgi:N-acyl-D-aspartate/D-glutamate deacylase